MITEIVVTAFMVLFTVPTVTYFSIKLGAYAYLRGRQLFQQDSLKEGSKHGEDQG